MKNAGSTRSYDCGTKETWRNTVWNILAKEADRSKPVIYLAGPEDNDRIAALRRGFGHHLLVAVNRDRDNIDTVKGQHGGIGIKAPLAHVCWAWPPTWRVGCILADFCSGVVGETARFVWALTQDPFQGTVVAVNLLRGRDPNPEDIIQIWLAHAERWREPLASLGRGHWLDVTPQSRAKRMLGLMTWLGLDPQLLSPLTSYKSLTGNATQVFDSMVVRLPDVPVSDETRALVDRSTLSVDESRKDRKLRRRLVALRAVSTRKASEMGPMLA